LTYFTADFTEIFIDSVSWGGASGGGKPSESVAFSFKTINLTYYQQDEKGSGQKAGNFGWDVKKNAKL
jgi:type VI protein secretion system component Hcp